VITVSRGRDTLAAPIGSSQSPGRPRHPPETLSEQVNLLITDH